MTEWAEQRICIKFCVSLNIPPWKLLGWFRRLQLWANGLAALSQQSACSFVISHRVFWVKHQFTWWLSPPQSRFGTLWCGAFLKTKITFEREEISDHQWDSGKYSEAADGDWESCVRSQVDYFEGQWGVIVLCTMYLASSSINVFIFHSACLDTFWTEYILKLTYI